MTASSQWDATTVGWLNKAYFGNDLDPRLHSAYDMSLYTQAPNDQYRHLGGHLYQDHGHLPLDDELDRAYKQVMPHPLAVAFFNEADQNADSDKSPFYDRCQSYIR